MKYLVLGSSGFIGKNLCEYLKKQNHEVIEFDINNNLKEDLRIANNINLVDALKSSDFIFFLAFDIGGSKYLQNSSCDKIFLLNNSKILQNTFEVLMRFDKKIIFISTFFIKNNAHSYGILKQLGEFFTHSVNGLVIRLYNVYGDEELSNRSHVIPDIINQAKKNNIIKLKTNGEEKRQFLYIDDCCEGLFIASQNYDKILSERNIFDLTTFKWVKIKKVAELVGSIFKCKVEFSSDNAQFNTEYFPDNFFKKFWESKITLEIGISKVINILK
jgi:nucleoside-diphosphate-sugar epimerase